MHVIRFRGGPTCAFIGAEVAHGFEQEGRPSAAPHVQYKVESGGGTAGGGAAGGRGLTDNIGREREVRPDQFRTWVRAQRATHGTGSAPSGETLERGDRRPRREVAMRCQEQAFAKKWRWLEPGSATVLIVVTDRSERDGTAGESRVVPRRECGAVGAA